MRHRLKHIVEYAALRGVGGLAGLLPYRLALGLAWLAAGLARLLGAAPLRRAEARIAQVFGASLSRREVNRIAWTAWRNFCFNVVEVMRVPFMTEHWIRKVINADQVGRLLEVKGGARGAIVAVPHMGNWELAGTALVLLGVPLMAIARRQKNELTDAYLNRVREHHGLEAVLRNSSSMRGVIPKLEAGKVLALLPDLQAKKESVRVPFLGGEANIARGMAVFAREAGVPILPAYVVRVGWARHRWTGLEPVRPDPALEKEADVRRMTERVMAQLDRVIRENPEQYFWFNKRWVLSSEVSRAEGGSEAPADL